LADGQQMSRKIRYGEEPSVPTCGPPSRTASSPAPLVTTERNIMHRAIPWILSALVLAPIAAVVAADVPAAPDGWRTESPRDEIRPAFSYTATGSRDGKGALVITHDRREGLDGAWVKTFPVEGGRFYRFHAVRKTTNVKSPRRSAFVRIL